MYQNYSHYCLFEAISVVVLRKYGLSVSLWMVPLCIGIGLVLPKYLAVNTVVECE